MKILIINPPIRLRDKPRNIPHGLAILANIIRKKFNCDLFFLDWNAHRYTEKQFNNLVKDFACDVALIGGLIPTYKYFIKIASTIKAYHPDCKIFGGGSAAMSIPETMLNNSLVDVVCTGEGEVTIVKLIEAFGNKQTPDLANIKGIAYRKSNGRLQINAPEPMIQDLDNESELPCYDLLPMDIYLSNTVAGLGRDIDFISSRGCPFSCSFCYQPWGSKSRRHSAEYLKEAILFLKKNYDINFVSFQDDLFIADRERLYEFCEMRNRFFPDIYWSCTGRANICDEDLIRTVRKSGCTLISYGFESGSPRMLKSMHKKINLDEMENAIRLNRKYGLPVPVSFILGMPGENEQSCNETVAFCKKNNISLDSLMFATPYPGTELFDFAIKTGRIKKENIHEFTMKLGDARDFIINLTDEFTDLKLKQIYNEMIIEARRSYKPVSNNVLEKKIIELYGPLADFFFNLSPEDAEHKKKHGAMSAF